MSIVRSLIQKSFLPSSFRKRSRLAQWVERFYTTRSQASEGSGLGRYICKLTVEELGGSIEATSTFGVSTRFTIRLPMSL